MANVEMALVCFGFGLVLSLAALRHRKPGAPLFAPLWRLPEQYDRRGVALNLAAFVLLLVGAGLMLAR